MPKANFDAQVPPALKKTQRWFAQVITRPLDSNDQMQQLSLQGKPMEKEAKQYIASSPTMAPHERIQIYNQQYWWRLLSNMHDIFPLVTRLFGYYHFNQQIAIPYLTTHPPTHWSLSYLGDDLPQWLAQHYRQEDQSLIINAANLDRAFNFAFTAPQYPPIAAQELSASNYKSFLKKKIYIQPHLHLFKLPYDLFAFREIFIKEEGDYWIDHDFPPLSKSNPCDYFLLYRTAKNGLAWRTITSAEHCLFSLFQRGCSIEKACKTLEEAGEALCQQAMENLHYWFQEWTMRQWLTPSS